MMDEREEHTPIATSLEQVRHLCAKVFVFGYGLSGMAPGNPDVNPDANFDAWWLHEVGKGWFDPLPANERPSLRAARREMPLKTWRFRSRAEGTKHVRAHHVEIHLSGALAFYMGDSIILAIPASEWIDLEEEEAN